MCQHAAGVNVAVVAAELSLVDVDLCWIGAQVAQPLLTLDEGTHA
jgi:hypothetical protein